MMKNYPHYINNEKLKIKIIKLYNKKNENFDII